MSVFFSRFLHTSTLKISFYKNFFFLIQRIFNSLNNYYQLRRLKHLTSLLNIRRYFV